LPKKLKALVKNSRTVRKNAYIEANKDDYVEMDEEFYKLLKLTPIFNCNHGYIKPLFICNLLIKREMERCIIFLRKR